MFVGIERDGVARLAEVLQVASRAATQLAQADAAARAAAQLAPPVPAALRAADRLSAVGRELTGRHQAVEVWSSPWWRDAPDGCRRAWPIGSTVLECEGAADGRAVVVIGDLTTASAVAVLVPGVGTTLATLDDELERAGALASAAGAGTAVIVWLGYDAPGWSRAVSPSAATAGGRALAEFLGDLRAPGTTRVTLIGHSYGSLVVAEALAAGASSDAVVLLGSPGVGVDRAAELGVGEVYAIRAPGDLVGALGAFGGVDPASARFGAVRLGAGGASGHSGYFEPGTGSLDNLAAVVTGRPEHLQVHHPTPGDQAGDWLGQAVAWVDDAVDAAQAQLPAPDWIEDLADAAQRTGSGLGGLAGRGAGNLVDDLDSLVGAWWS